MSYYYLIEDLCKDGYHEYYDKCIVESKTKDMHWDDKWEDYYLMWQFTINSVELNNFDPVLWSDDRIVEVWKVRELSKAHYDVLSKYLHPFIFEEIMEDGKKSWKEMEEEKNDPVETC
jgi:hypothetical protein